MKVCKQCGKAQAEDNFRKYYGGRKGLYNYCKTCEKINSRAKYLDKKSERTEKEDDELQGIFLLWQTQRDLGYAPPKVSSMRGSVSIAKSVADLMEDYKKQKAMLEEVAEEMTTAPPELAKWLTCKLIQEPDYYLDDVYENLREQFKPILRVDDVTKLPVYDTKYSGILDKILDRFNKYEDDYYEE